MPQKNINNITTYGLSATSTTITNENNYSGVPPSSSNTTSTSTSQHEYTSGTNKFRTRELLSLKVTPGEGDDSKSITPEKDVEMDEGNVVGSTPLTAAVPANEGTSLDLGEASRTYPLDIFMEAVELREAKAVDDRATFPADDEMMGESNSNKREMAANMGGDIRNGSGATKSNGDSSTGEDDKVAMDKKVTVESLNDGSNNGENKGDKSAAPPLVGEKEKEGEPTPSAPPVAASVIVIDPILVGTLAYSDRDNLRRHIIRGSWKYKDASAPPERFELIRHIPPEEDLKELPKDGEFNGSFTVQMQVKTSKGKIKVKSRAVLESGVKLTFKPKDETEEIYDVNGTGLNEFGVFELYGSATKNRLVVNEDPTYSVSVHKRYVIVTPRAVAPTAAVTTAIDGGEAESKDKKRKYFDTVREEEVKPQPTIIPAVGVCLRGTLVRNTSEELSLDNTAVHRITGLWSMMGLTAILDEPIKCEKFEYEHKTSGDSVFPLSGKYTGFFYVSDGPEGRTKVAERDVTLKFIPNSEGHHNVEGRGSNVFGKYSITGTLLDDGLITLSRHFQAIKLKASKKPSVTGAVANGVTSNSTLPFTVEVAALVAHTSPSLLTFDDVDIPKGDELPGVPSPLDPPEQFAATSRGILKIEPDGTHTCSGSWALSNEHFQNGLTSKYHFGVTTDKAEDDASDMLDRIKACNLKKDDDRQIQNVTNENGPVTLAHSTFPLDSMNYKGSFKLRKGPTRTQTIIDNQIILKFVKNSGGSYNVYGKGVNEMGTFDIKGTLILQGKSNGLMQLYRIYPPVSEGAAPIIQSTGAKKSSKVFRGGLTEKATPENSGPAPAMTPAERFIPSASGLLRRESSRQLKPPARLEEDDPSAIMNRCMDKCRMILQEMNNADVQKIFAAPVDPKALGIPTYFAVIKDPMDLGSIKTMMDNDEIDSPEEFARLVRLTFENAITFNSLPDNIVHVQARNLLALFTKKFGTIDKTFNSARKNKTLSKAERQEQRRKEKDARKDAQKKEKKEKDRKRRAEIEASNESKRMKLENVLAANKAAMAAIADAVPKNPSADVSRTEFNLLLVALRNVQGQIVGLHKLIKKASSNPASSVNAADNLVTAPSYDDESAHDNAGEASYQPPKAKKKKVKKEYESSISPPPSPKQSQASVVENLQPLTFEEQEALSDAINLLPERLLPDAMKIIRESDFVNDDDDEIDLDIDQLDTRTQRKLQRFVMEVRLPSMVFCDFANE